MTILVVMGVSGAGKSTVAQALANTLNWPFIEGDTLHSPANVEKMSQGIPLNDTDREPWLRSIRQLIDDYIKRDESAVITCSALKQTYRDILAAHREQVIFIYLKGSEAFLRKRMAQRRGHYMPLEMLDSQLATLEEPQHAIVADINQDLKSIVGDILEQLHLQARGRAGR